MTKKKSYVELFCFFTKFVKKQTIMNVKLFFTLLLCCLCFYIDAQEENIQQAALYPDYVDGKVIMKNKSVIKARLNYDCIKGEMNYLENDVDMILDGLNAIDTVYLDGRAFVPSANSFREVFRTNHAPLFVEWKTKVVQMGKKGAMGAVTHGGTISKFDVKYLRKEGYDNSGDNQYRFEPINTYYMQVDGKLKQFNSTKSFYKLFSKEKAQELQDYISAEKINIQKPAEVVRLINEKL